MSTPHIPSHAAKQNWALAQTKIYMQETYPEYIYRKDDGFRFTRQLNNNYTMDKSMMNPKKEYNRFELLGPEFTTDPKQINILENKEDSDSHQ